MNLEHVPVMLKEVLEALNPQDGEIIVDGTFGRGGYSQAFLNAADCVVWGIDQDPDAVEEGKKLEKEKKNRFHMIKGRFGELNRLLAEHGMDKVNAVAFDLGVSSPQIDKAERGFAFSKEGPLDMRMSQEGPTAADLINTLPEEELANIFYEYGEERHSRKIAKRIVARRREAPIVTTKQLADVIYSVLPKHGKGIDPATRTFQALRIKVNDELNELARGMDAAEQMLVPGGRLAVVSFHSLEDRCVKQFMKSRSEQKSSSGYRHLPDLPESKGPPTFKLIHSRAIKPSEEEIRKNPRARSAKLRWAVRTEVPAQGGVQ